MKKKLLFVQESLRLAGSEKSLITLLKNIDCNKYEIDLQLMSYGGELEKELPNYVNLLPELKIKQKLNKTLVEHFFSIRSLNDIKLFKERLRYSKKIRGKKKKHSEKAQLFWETIGKSITPSKKEYDAAIGFAQGFPTFYVMDKVIAQKKFCWINANMVLEGEHREYIKNYYEKFNKVICVTIQSKDIIQKQIPSLNNLILLEDMVDYQDIIEASNAKDVGFDKNITNILTVGRLNKNSKGMDIALEASKALKQKGVKFHWYFLGEGPFEDEMKEYIVNNALQDSVTLLGTDPNPYPYFKAADIYVQTSRHEGFGRTIAEARLLNVPIVTTNFDTVHMQMIHEKNGLITDMDPESVAHGIERMMTDKNLYQSVVEYLKNEPKINTETVKKFDELVQSLS